MRVPSRSCQLPAKLLAGSRQEPYIARREISDNFFFCAQAMSQSADSLVGNAHLITKVYFPRLVVPLSAALVHWWTLLLPL